MHEVDEKVKNALAPNRDQAGRAALWTGRVLTVLVVLPFIMGITMVATGNQQSLDGLKTYGWNPESMKTICALEAITVVLFLLPRLSILGAIVMTGYLGGAIATHLRVGEAPWMPLIIGGLAWLAVFLREPRLRVLIPARGYNETFAREVDIALSREQVFAYLRNLKNFENWNPFLKSDPNVKMQYRGVDGTPGFQAAWSGEKVGSGEQEIIRVIENDRIEFDLRFFKPFKSECKAFFQTSSMSDGKTKVIWVMESQAVFPMTIFGLIMNMKKMMEKTFDSGLNDLKTTLEK